jgi:hypothetical protein
MENLTKDREKVQHIAQGVLDGQTGVIDAARTLVLLLRRSPELASKEDFNLVRAIESETDDLPLGQVRELWDPAALANKDREIARCESLWRDEVRAACGRILQRLQTFRSMQCPPVVSDLSPAIRKFRGNRGAEQYRRLKERK